MLTIILIGAGCGTGGGSTSISTSSTPSNPPPAPSSSTHSVTLSWTASVSPQVTGYFVYRRPSNGAYALLNQSATPSTSYVDLDVQAGQSLVYEVTAVDNQLTQSAPSAEVQVTIPQ